MRLLLALVLPVVAWPQNGIWFEANQGQTDARASFLVRTRQATVFLTPAETVYALRSHHAGEATVRASLRGSQSGPWVGENRRKATIDSYVGPRSSWRQGIPTFERVRQTAIYPGVDLVYYGKGRELEYDFVLAPGADPKQIRLAFAGANATRLSPAGDIEISTPAGTLVHRRPRVWQDGVEVASSFRVTGHDEFGVRLGHYDPARPLTIDPVVSFTSFYGGEGEDVITAMTGSAVAGYTNSVVFPGTSVPGAGGYDAFFATFGADERVAYVGGSGDDKAWAVFSSSANTTNVEYGMAGETNSPDFPAFERSFSPNSGLPTDGAAFQSKYGGGKSDGFFFSSTRGGNLGTIHSSYLGGSGDDRILSMILASNGFIAVGETDSPNFPVDSSASQPVLAGGKDGFYFRFDRFFRWSTFFGGSGDDSLTHISTSGTIAGTTTSPDLPLVNPLQATPGGGRDALLLFMDTFRFRPSFATYLGGSGDEQVFAVRGLAIVGSTTSPDFPGAAGTAPKGGRDGFVTDILYPQTDFNTGQLLTPGRIERTTLIGGAGDDEFRDALVSGTDLVLAGVTNSPDLPQRDALQAAYGGGESDAWVAVLDRDRQLLFSSYFGGAGKDEARGIGLDSANRWLVAGNSNSPSLAGAGEPGTVAYAGGADGFFMRFTTPVLSLSGPFAAKGAGTFGFLGAANLTAPVPLRIRSADPARLLLSLGGVAEPAAEVATDWDGRALNFRMVALTDTGTAEVIATAEGIPERRITVPLLPVELRLEVSQLGRIPENGEFRLPAGSSTQGLSVRPVAVVRLPGQSLVSQVFYPAAEGPAHTLEIVSSNPKVFSTRPTTIRLLPGNGIPSFQSVLELGEPGVTQLTARISGSLGTLTSAPVTLIHEEPRLSLDRFFSSLTAGFFTGGSVRLGGVAVPPVVTVTSEDPDAAQLALTNTSVPGSTITLRPTQSGFYPGFYVAGVTAGRTARLRATAPGYEDSVQEVPVGPVAYGFESQPTYVAPLGQNVGVNIGTFSATPPGARRLNVTPVQPVTFRVQSSNPAVFAVAAETVTLQPGAWNANVIGRPLAPGTATLELTGPPEAEPLLTRIAITVPAAVPANNALTLQDAIVGRDLQTRVFYQWATQSPATSLTLTSSDPSKLLVSNAEDRPGAASVTGSFASNNFPGFWIQALSGEGQVTLTLTSGNASTTATVRLVPSYAALNTNGELRSPAQAPLSFSVGLYAQPPGGSLSGLMPAFFGSVQTSNALSQGPRAGLGPVTLSLSSSNAAVGALQETNNRAGWRAYSIERPLPGETTLTAAVSGGPFRLSPRGQSLRLTVLPVQLSLFQRLVVLPKGTQSFVRPQLPPALANLNRPLTFTATSSDPGSLLISPDGRAAGTPAAEVQGSLYLQALADAGSARVDFAGPGIEPTSLNVQFQPAAVTHSLQLPRAPGVPNVPDSGETPTLTVGEQPAQLSFGLTLASSTSAGPGFALRPGLEIPVRLEVDPPGALTLSTAAPIAGQAPVAVTANRPGRALIRVTGTDEYPALAASREIPIDVKLPTVSLNGGVLTKDFQITLFASAPNAPVTITSSDPARLLLSLPLQGNPSQPATTGQPTITLTGGGPFFAIGLGEGTVTLSATAPGFQATQSTVRIVPLVLALTAPERLSLRATNNQVQVTPVLPGVSNPGSGFGSQQTPRAGAPPITLRLESSHPDIAVAQPDTLNQPVGAFALRLRTAGVVTFRLVTPEGVTANPPEVTIDVFAPPVELNNLPSRLGKETMVGTFLAGGVTLRSGDPSRLLFSLGENEPPGGTVTARGNSQVFLHALATGTVEILAEAEGFAPTSRDIQIWPVGLTFSSPSVTTTTLTPIGLSASLTLLDPVSLNPAETGLRLRPGVTVSAPVTTSDASVATLDRAVVTIAERASGAEIRVTPRGTGTATITLQTPPGFATPRTGAQTTVRVDRARIQVFGDTPVVAQLLRLNAFFNIPGPAPAGGLRVTITSSDPQRVLVSTSPTAAPTASVSTLVAAGSTGATYYLHGVADSGTATVTLSAEGLTSAEVPVRLAPGSFALQQRSVFVAAGQQSTITVLAGPLDEANRFSEAYGVSPLAGFVPLSMTSDDANIARPVGGIQVVPSFTSINLFIEGRTRGTTTLRLVTPPRFRAPADSSLVTATVNVGGF